MKMSALACLTFAFIRVGSVFAEDSMQSQIPSLSKVVVRNGDSGWLSVKWISDPAQLKNITDFINKNWKGRSESTISPPGGSLSLDLYNGTNFCGQFEIGDNFFVFGSVKRVSQLQREELLRLIGEIPKKLSEVVLPGISNITTIIVSTNLAGGSGRKIIDPHQINRIVEFVNRQRTGWDKPWTGKQMPDVTLKFQSQDGFVAQFGIGPEFFETCSDEIFIDCRRKDGSREQSNEILKLVE
jgi:hypothetical protein